MAPLLPQVSPSSNSSACRAVRTSTASPRPTSRIVASKLPVGMRAAAGHMAGSSANMALARIHGRHGSSATASATAASAYHQDGGEARSSAIGLDATACSAGQMPPITRAASLNSSVAAAGQNASTTVAANTSGTSSRLKIGIANRLTSRPASDTDPNTATVTGTSAIVTKPWVRSIARQPARGQRVQRALQQQHGDGEERQPETGGERRERIEQQHAAQSRRQRPRRRDAGGPARAARARWPA